MDVRRLNSEALIWEEKFPIVMACSKFQLSANMKSKNLSLNEKIAMTWLTGVKLLVTRVLERSYQSKGKLVLKNSPNLKNLMKRRMIFKQQHLQRHSRNWSQITRRQLK